jgi:hypothetical protein
MGERACLPLVLLLAACSVIGEPETVTYREPKPGDIVGTVEWKPVTGRTVEEARSLAAQACARRGLNANQIGEKENGASATLRYSCG